MAEKPEIILKPIGFVRSEAKEREKEAQDWWQELVSEIVIDESLAEGLDDLEKYPYIIVLYWLHKQAGSKVMLKIHPRNSRESKIRGLFSTRSPRRPNPIGMITVKLLKREGNVLTVQGLDALDGTPVIDIKPWNVGYDAMDGKVYRD